MRPPVNHILDLPVHVIFTLKEFLRGQDIILLSLTSVAGPFSTVGAAGLAFHHIQIALRYQRLIKAGVPDTMRMRRAVPDTIRLVHQDATLSPVRMLHRIMDPIFKTMSRGTGDCDYALPLQNQDRAPFLDR
ncbi:hypothetical protein HMPREF1624_08583 [Sporothrix schenckii ATCC 58251]|uniref:Uncharacterized protein n=1 Tax=Sporothrix schenckii (strain ATCC 58251 / de Perez 2211183) TaxID=1391915 RepID=U7PK36_SPOS1|nr:hypothetical protein HMPREF1624_08583 [Sporothrix schenckii ATCC 58251]